MTTLVTSENSICLNGDAACNCLADIEYWDGKGILRTTSITEENGWITKFTKGGTGNMWYSRNNSSGLYVTFEVTEEEDSVILKIPCDEIKEGGCCKIKTIRPFPGLISTIENKERSLVLPVDNGGLCYCHGKLQAEHKLPVFYPLFWPSMCNMAIFGLDFGEGKAISAIVEGGKYDFALFIRTAWGDEKRYSIDPSFAIRDYRDELPLAEDIIINYSILENSCNGYISIARHYREYNLEKKKLPALKEKIRNNPDLEYSAKALSIRCRMAVKQMPTPVLEQTPETQPPMTIFMNFDNIAEVVEECAKQEVGPAEFNLVGWNYGGHDGAFPQLFPVEPQLGGEERMHALIDKSQALGYPVSVHDNYFDSYTLANNHNPEYINISHDGSQSLGGQYGGGQAYEVCPKCAAENYAPGILDEVKRKLKVKGAYYTDVLSVAQLSKCYSKKHPVSRRENAKYWKQIFTEILSRFNVCESEGARDWSLPEIDRLYCVGGPAESALPYIDEGVPLYQIVYHGFVIYNSYRAGINTFPGEDIYLKNLTWGGIPTIYYHQIFNPEWNASDGWDKDLKFTDHATLQTDVSRIKNITNDIAKLAHLQTEFIEDYRVLDNDITETVFSNGEKLYANYSESPAKLPDGSMIDPKNFKLI